MYSYRFRIELSIATHILNGRGKKAAVVCKSHRQTLSASKRFRDALRSIGVNSWKARNGGKVLKLPNGSKVIFMTQAMLDRGQCTTYRRFDWY